ncbi:glycoside hydrolase 5 family protein [Acidipropionibacterium timonense]|uniref:glycoside hydrolase 5 family protein n=1 Tax=Acidipropionibacterium timonense TaxID=2161818 RepID=UPI001030B0C5|nr:hypothetical protein [Acidipropionibacterium timonense]
MRVGVNWTPSQGWFHSWLDLDLDAARRDFEAIAALGLDHVRIFPLWPLLQPNRGLIRPKALDDLVDVVRCARQAGLDVHVDALNGHLSSYDFLPSWVTTWHRSNLFTDPEVVAGEAALVTAVASRLAEEPGVLGLTLGNEFPQFAALAPGHTHPDRSPCRVEEVDRWLSAMQDAVAAGWPGASAHLGFDDDLWFVDDHPFTPRHAVTTGPATTVHSWVFAQVGPRFGAGHPALTWFPRYLVELARAWSPDPSRPIWVQEVGAPRTHVPDDAAADFVAATVEHLLDAPAVEAITWWCSHDVSRDLLDFPELEYSLGLFRADGTPKPEALQLAEMVEDLHRDRTGARGVTRTGDITFEAAWHDGVGRSACAPTGELFAGWVEQAEATGRAPSIRRS